jgi:hypothetical protein
MILNGIFNYYLNVRDTTNPTIPTTGIHTKRDALFKAAQFKKVVDMCKSCHRCPSCGYPNGVVRYYVD